MSHTFLSIDVSLIPAETKENIPSFDGETFSKDGKRMLLDGKNENGKLVHSSHVLHDWVQWSENQQAVIDSILSTSIEYSLNEVLAMQSDINSIWYIEPKGH